MRTLRKPTHEAMEAFAIRQEDVPFSYPEVGASDQEPLPQGYAIDRYGCSLGTGEARFDRARADLLAWRQCDLGWVSVVPAPGELAIGQDLAVRVSIAGMHYVNGGRVTVYRERSDPDGRVVKLGYGTLATHAEIGEETFTVSWDRVTDDVRYDVVAFSRPRLLSARLLHGLTRRLQRRFARHTMARMQRDAP